MTAYVQIVRSRSLPGKVTQYRDWYIGTHIPEVLSLEGFTSANLLQLVAPSGASNDFLCLYELETEDLATTQAAMLAGSAEMRASSAMDVAATRIDFYEKALS